MNENRYHADLLRILRNLDEVPAREYAQYIAQYEDCQYKLGKRFFMTSHYQLRYVRSLFEQGRYYKFIANVDESLEYLINREGWNDGGKQDFMDLLYKKAAGFLHARDYVSTRKICSQLQNMGYGRKELEYLRGLTFKSRAKDLFGLLHSKNFYIAMGIMIITGMILLIRMLLIK
jgi:hypothetical protein